MNYRIQRHFSLVKSLLVSRGLGGGLRRLKVQLDVAVGDVSVLNVPRGVEAHHVVANLTDYNTAAREQVQGVEN